MHGYTGLYNRIHNKVKMWVHKTSLTTPFLLKCLYQTKKVSGDVPVYVIKFVSDLRRVGVFLRVLRFLSPIKLIATL
jgi:hypothetical protein